MDLRDLLNVGTYITHLPLDNDMKISSNDDYDWIIALELFNDDYTNVQWPAKWQPPQAFPRAQQLYRYLSTIIGPNNVFPHFLLRKLSETCSVKIREKYDLMVTHLAINPQSEPLKIRVSAFHTIDDVTTVAFEPYCPLKKLDDPIPFEYIHTDIEVDEQVECDNVNNVDNVELSYYCVYVKKDE